jgi:hypothetical protein
VLNDFIFGGILRQLRRQSLDRPPSRSLLGLADDSNRFIALLLETIAQCRWSTSRRSLDWSYLVAV